MTNTDFSPVTTLQVSRGARPQRRPALLAGDVLELVERSREALLHACHAHEAAERYSEAHLGALRACAAVLAQHAPRTVGSRPSGAWETLARIAPECAEWAAFFQAAGRRSRAALAGLAQIDQREADDLIRQSELFLGVVLEKLGLPPQVSVAQHIVPLRAGGVSERVRGRAS